MVVHELTCWVCGCYWVTIDELWESIDRDKEDGAQFLKSDILTMLSSKRCDQHAQPYQPQSKGESLHYPVAFDPVRQMSTQRCAKQDSNA